MFAFMKINECVCSMKILSCNTDAFVLVLYSGVKSVSLKKKIGVIVL